MSEVSRDPKHSAQDLRILEAGHYAVNPVLPRYPAVTGGCCKVCRLQISLCRGTPRIEVVRKGNAVYWRRITEAEVLWRTGV